LSENRNQPAKTESAVALSDAYWSTYDARLARDLLFDEVLQRRESGYNVDDIVHEANQTDPADRDALLELVDRMEGAERIPGWSYEEPDDLADITASLVDIPSVSRVDRASLEDRIRAAWLGRIAGCNVGKPVEDGWEWTSSLIREYLELAGAYPLRDYVPLLDPLPERFVLRDNWPETTKGNVKGSARDDDIDYTILGLHLLEKHGASLSPEHVAEAWLTLFPLEQVYTAERAAYINLTNSIEGDAVSRFRNPYREWIGAQIRGDIYGYVFPGDPWAAAQLSYQDASLSHVGNGIYGEMWAAALVAAAFSSTTAREAIDTATRVVPPQSRLAESIRFVVDLFDAGVSWEDAIVKIEAQYGHYSWVHTINNAALVVAGLLWGEGDYMKSLGLTVMGGWDTDSNGATVGSVAGILSGTDGLPPQLIYPLENRTRSALFGFDNSVISDLAARTYKLTTQGLG
jgi:ADP-ribosylglycohydrolase